MDPRVLDTLKTRLPALTATETRVIALVEAGRTNKEIAELYGCTVRNIENHRYRIGKKLSARSTKAARIHIGSSSVAVRSDHLLSQEGLRVQSMPQMRLARTIQTPTPSHRTDAPDPIGTPRSMGAGSHRSQGWWLLPGVLFNCEQHEPWV